jgi:hypothetical protein
VEADKGGVGGEAERGKERAKATDWEVEDRSGEEEKNCLGWSGSGDEVMTGGPERNEVELARLVWEEGEVQAQEEGESEKLLAHGGKQFRTSNEDELKRQRMTRTSLEPKMT